MSNYDDIFTPMPVLDALISRGWGSTPWSEIPSNWRRMMGPEGPPSMHFRHLGRGRPPGTKDTKQRRQRRSILKGLL
jgi:hypothetical protein